MKSSFDSKYQEEVSINHFSSDDQLEKKAKAEKMRIEDGYKDNIVVGYTDRGSIPSGKSWCGGKPSQMNKTRNS